MSIARITGSGDVKRKFMACAIDVSDEGTTPEYMVVGYKISESTLEFNADNETGTDINGRNFGSVNKFEPSQSFEPHRLTAGPAGKLGEKMLHYFRYNQMDKFSQFKCILIYGFLESDVPGSYVADMYDSCTVIPQSLGGESWTEMPFEVTFGGNVTHGYVNDIVGTVEFTEETPDENGNENGNGTPQG